MAAAIIVVILAVTVGRACWKKPNAGARLAALLGLTAALFLAFAVTSPSGAATFLTDAASGLGQLFAGIGNVIKMVPHA